MFRLLQSLIGSQGGRVPLASRGQRPCRRQAKPPHEARILRTECGYSARRRAVKTFKSAKGVWGKTRVFPHKQHIKSNCTYPPKQSGGLFRKHTTPLNYSLSTNQKEAARAASFIRSIVLHICHSQNSRYNPTLSRKNSTAIPEVYKIKHRYHSKKRNI